MKYIKSLLALLAVVTLLSVSAYAAEIEYTVSDIDAGTLTVSGTVPYSSHQKWVTVSILNPGYDTASGMEAINCMKQTVVSGSEDSAEGTFSVKMQITNPTETDYKIRVSYYGATEPLEKTMSYYSSSALTDLCADIKAARDGGNLTELKSLLGDSDVLSFLGIRTAIIKDAAFDDICEELIENQKISMVATTEGVRRAYEEAASLVILATDKGAGYLEVLRGDNKEAAIDVLKGGYDSSVAYEVFAETEDGVAGEIIEKLKGKTYKSGNDFNESFEFEVLNCNLKAADSYLEVRGLMTQYKDVFTTSWQAEYNRLSGSEKTEAEIALLEKVKRGGMSSTDDIGEAFRGCIADADDKPAGGGSTGGGFGGLGGGGFGGGGGTTSIRVEDSLVQDVKEETAVNTDVPFIDLEDVPWAVEGITYLANNGVISGKSKLIFEPVSNVKREEFIKMVVLAFGISTEDVPECSFEDVLITDWFHPYVSAGVQCGIIKGVNEYFFGSGADITRQDMAVILCRAAEYTGMTLSGTPISFPDGETISDYAREAVDKISAVGAASGDENGFFMPHASATRAEAAKMIYYLVKPE